MAAIDNKKTKSMECSYLNDHQLALYYSVLAKHFERSIKKNIWVEMLHWLNKTKQMKHPKLRAELRPSEE